MRKLLTQVAAGVAVVAVASLALLTTSAQALPPGTAAAAPGVLSPLTGTNTSSFSFAPPVGAACPGDGPAGYRWRTFFVAASVDPATLTYNASGPVSQGGAYSQPLYTFAGGGTGPFSPSITTGLITGIPAALSFANNTMPVPSGAYNIGYVCTLTTAGVTNTERFWVTPITIANSTATSFDYAFGSGYAPAAPVLGGTLVPGDQTLNGTFTAASSVPATTGYTVTAVPTSGATVTLPLAAGVTTFSLSGLVNGTSYAVSVVATNTVGSSAPSNIVNGTPNPLPRPAVTLLTGTAGTGIVTLNWVAPTGVAPLDYTIAVSPTTGITGSPFTAAAGATSFVVTGTPGTAYTFTVTPNHTSPYVGTSASVGPVAPNAAQIIIQDITVVRPAGALVLTQRCGVNGALPIEPVSPGFPSLAGVAASANEVGTAPTFGGLADPQFANYPSPASPNYPTRCGVNLGTAQLVTSGTLTGQYYTANGFINQVTVSDTRDDDTGWTVNGTMSAFTAPGASFSGNYLGWSPVVSSTSGPTSGGYDQTATAGASVPPDTATGLATPKALSSAAAGAGLGIASFDARLKLLIPVSARAGTYNGTLTFTVI